MKKNDIILLITILLLSIILFAGYRLFFRRPGACVSISVDGQPYRQLRLDQEISLDIKGAEGGVNRLEIKNGTARITHADCPDKLCVHQKPIKNNGETLVCLPHKVIVRVSSQKQTTHELDGISN